MSKWYDNTSLDFSLLDGERQNKVIALATSTQHFYEKYILLNNKKLLETDLVNALETTDEYAADLTEKIFSYFNNYYTPQPSGVNTFEVQTISAPQPIPDIIQHPILNQPQNIQTNTILPVYPIEQNIGSNVVGGLSKDEVGILLRDVKSEIWRSFNEQLSQQKELYNQQLSAANQEISTLKQDILKQSELLKQLADSYNRLRDFVQDWINNSQRSSSSTAPPVSYSAVPPPGSQGQRYSTPISNPDASSSYDSYLSTSPLIPTVEDCVFIENHVTTWYNNKECRVFIDYIAAEPVIACTWKIHTLKSDGFVRLAFIYDTAFGMKEHQLKDQGCELRNDKLFVIRRFKEKYEGFVQGDTIRIELCLSHRFAIFFKNERQLPFRVINIPNSCRFYFIGGGAATSVEVTHLVSIPQITIVPNAPPLKEFDILKC